MPLLVLSHFDFCFQYYRLCSYITQPTVAPTQQVAAPAMYAAAGDTRYSVPSGYVQQMAPPPTLVARPPTEADYCGQFEGDKSLVKDQHGRIFTFNHKALTPAQTQYIMNINSMSHVDPKPAKPREKSEVSSSGDDHSGDLVAPVSEVAGVVGPTSPEHVVSPPQESKHDESTDSSECPCDDNDKHSPHDSGCVSDASSGHCEATLSNDEPDPDSTNNQETSTNCTSEVSRSEIPSQTSPDIYNDDDILELLRQPVFTRAPKYKPNKKNGSTKLVRPIKDIPPRFKKLLETEALAQAAALRKNQFEGTPLVRPVMMGRGRRHRNTEAIMASNADMSQANFNPNARSFIPGQPYQCTYEHSGNGVNYVAIEPSKAVQVEAGSSSSSYVAGTNGSGSGDGSLVVSNTSTFSLHIVNGQSNNASSSAEGYYSECPSNSVCVSSSGTYYSTAPLY